MRNPPYFPSTNTVQLAWATNFAALLTANPTDYGLTAPDAVPVQAAADDFEAAMVLATNPATRTPVTVADKDAALAALKSVIYPVATAIASDASVSNGLKTGIGVSVKSTVRTRNAVTAQEMGSEVIYTKQGLPVVKTHDLSTPDSSGRPLGAIGWRIQVNGSNGLEPPDEDAAICFDAVFSRPQGTVNPANFTSQWAEYVYRTRWVGALLVGGAMNEGPWTEWAPLPTTPTP